MTFEKIENGLVLWNSVPSEIQTTHNLDDLKKRLNIFLRNVKVTLFSGLLHTLRSFWKAATLPYLTWGGGGGGHDGLPKCF